MSRQTYSCTLGSINVTPGFSLYNNALNLSNINDTAILNDNGEHLYDKIKDLGQGTYGKVYLVKQLSTNKKLVIKQMKHFPDEEGGVQPTMLREVSLLQNLKSIYIVEMIHVFWNRYKDFCIVFEHCSMDLFAYIQQLNQQKKYKFDNKLLKKWSLQMILGINYMHCRRIFHRDLKPQNILITHDMNVKIADLGLGKEHQYPLKPATTEIVTLWYRAPELLLGSELYCGKIDIWSIGAILAEMARGHPIFNGYSEWEMLIKMFQFLGTPNILKDDQKESLTKLKYFNMKFPKFKPQPFNKEMGRYKYDKLFCDLVKKMLVLEPSKRFHAIRLEKHEWFDDVRNNEKKRRQKDEHTLGDGYIFDKEKWNQYLEIMRLPINDSPDHEKQTNNMEIIKTPETSIVDFETIKMGLIPSTIKCKKRKIINGNDEDITLGICDCNDCNHNHQKLMYDAFEGNVKNDDYKYDNKKSKQLMIGSRKILSNSDNEESENEGQDTNKDSDNYTEDEDDDIDIEYHRKKQFEKNRNKNGNKVKNKRKRSRKQYEDQDDIKEDIGNVKQLNPTKKSKMSTARLI